MADRYLLESGSPDGFTLEDGSGVLLLEEGAAAAPFRPNQVASAPRAPSSQGGYSTVPNLLVTTLALFAVASQDVKRDADLHSYKPAPAVQVFQPPNLLTSTLGVQVVAPVGEQSTQPAPSVNNLNEWQQYHNPLLFTLPLPQGQQHTDSAPPPIDIGAAQQNQSRLVLEQVVQPIPIGRQQTDSAPTVNRVLYWDKGTNTLLFTLPLPTGRGQIDSAPIQTSDVSAELTQSRAVLEQAQQPIPIGVQRTDNEVQIPSVQVFTPEQIIPPTVVQAALPPGHQSTDSSPPTSRIGEMIYARGVDPGPPAPESGPLPIGRQETDSAPVASKSVDSFRSPTIIPPIVVAAELPIGDQKTESAPYTIFRPLIDEPQNLLAGPLGLQPLASSQSEGLPTIRPSQVFLWLPPNVTITIPVAAQEIPVGEQRTETQVTRSGVTVFTPEQIIPPILQDIPIGDQRTESAPIPAPGVQSFTSPVIVPPVVPEAPVGTQQVDSAPIPGPAVQSFTAPVIIPPIPQALPVGAQRTESSPIPAPAVQSFTAPVIVPPISGPLPIGQGRVESAPIWAVPIGTAVGSTILPDLLPPAPPEPPRVEILGGDPVKKRKKSPREEIRDLLNEPSGEKVVLAPPAPELPKVLQPVAKVVPVEYLPPITAPRLEEPPPPAFSDEEIAEISRLIELGIL